MASSTKKNSLTDFPEGIITRAFEITSGEKQNLITYYILNKYGEYIPILNGKNLTPSDDGKMARFKYILYEYNDQAITMAELSNRTEWPTAAKGLFFSVDNYTTLGTLRGCVDGMEKLADVFEDKYKLKDKIIRLSNECVTKETFLKYMKYVISNSAKGDKLVIYFSGHAKPQNSKNNSKKIIAICPYNEESVITESEIYWIVNKLHPQARLWLIFDTCYSGGLPEESHFTQFKKYKEGKVGDMTWLLGCAPEKYSFIYSFEEGFYSGYTYFLTKELERSKNEPLTKLNSTLREKFKEYNIPQTPKLVGDKALLATSVFDL